MVWSMLASGVINSYGAHQGAMGGGGGAAGYAAQQAAQSQHQHQSQFNWAEAQLQAKRQIKIDELLLTDPGLQDLATELKLAQEKFDAYLLLKLE